MAAEMKRKKTRRVRLREMSSDERFRAELFGSTLPGKSTTRAEREDAMFDIDSDAFDLDVMSILKGDRKPLFCVARNPDSPHVLFREMLDFHASGKWRAAAHEKVLDVTFMLAQFAHQVGSCALDDVLRLRIECCTAESFTNANADRLAAAFARCWNLVMAKYEVMSDEDRLKIRVQPPQREPVRKCAVDFDAFTDLPPEDRTQAEMERAIEEVKRRHPGYMERVEDAHKLISRAADQLAANGPFQGEMAKFFGDSRNLRTIFSADTDIEFNEYSETDGGEVCERLVHEKSDESLARMKFAEEIGRFLDAATARARAIGSQTSSAFVRVRHMLDLRKGDFSAPPASENFYFGGDSERKRLEASMALNRFLDIFHDAYTTFCADLAAAKLGGEQPMKVELTKKSGETIAKAVRPGKGGARRMFDEDIQEKCWRYWETGRRNPAVIESMRESGRKVTRADVFAYYRRELAALDPPIDTLEAFESALRARTNRLSRSQTRKKSH